MSVNDLAMSCVVCGRVIPKGGCRCDPPRPKDREPRVSTPRGFVADSGDYDDGNAAPDVLHDGRDHRPWQPQPLHLPPAPPIEPAERAPVNVVVADMPRRARRRA